MKAEIICIGTELLLGQTANTNATWLADQLNQLGVYVYYHTVVGDNAERIKASFQTAVARSDLVLVTGGLGPTQDDMTLACAAQVAGLPLKPHAGSRQAIIDAFARLGRPEVPDNNWKQALLPHPCVVLPNHQGTAPGCILSVDAHKAHLVLLPGPPAELRPMFLEALVPWLSERVTTRLRHVFVKMIGIGESAAETLLQDLIQSQKNPTIAPYASAGQVTFRITQSLVSVDDLDLIEPLLDQIRQRAGAYIYEVGTRTLPELVRDRLLELGQTVSFAESCTGGLMAKQLTDCPGASQVFQGGLVAYDNAVKRDLLGVGQALLDSQGAVSQACALAMADGCLDLFQTDWALSVTGIAGPAGGSEAKPLGTVYVALAGKNGSRRHQAYRFSGSRDRIRLLSALNAFDLIRRTLHEPATPIG